MKHGVYHNETAHPHQAKMGHSDGMYDAKVSDHFKGEMMNISYGKYGEKGYDKDASRIAPYMMYNDNADQNGY
jgi:hypothetical protein